MARDLNRHECIGRLGKDPELKYQPSGEAVCNINVACSNTWKDKATGQKQERTEWIRYVAFGRLAEIIGEYAKKGSKIYITGELRTRKWTNQQGVDQYTTEIVASDMQLLDGRSDDDSSGQQRAPAQQSQRQQPATTAQHTQPNPPAGFDSFDDDIPFSYEEGMQPR